MYLIRISPKTLDGFEFSHINPNKAKLRVKLRQYDIIEAEMNEFGNITKLILLDDPNYTYKVTLLGGIEPRNYKKFDNLYDVISYLLSLL